MTDYSPTTAQDRMDILAEINEASRDTLREWLRSYECLEDQGILRDARVGLSWQDDGTVIVKLNDEPVGRLRVEITTSFVESLDATNEPTGFRLRRTWATVPSGWFVQTPKGDWLEVGRTSFEDSTGKQLVSLRFGEVFKVFPRDPDQEVLARRGILAPRERDDAISALNEAFTTAILHDEPPGQS